MNIFRPHESPIDSARALADRHVVKMALESAQILCGPDDVPGETVEARYRALLARKYAAWGDAARWTNAVRPGWA